MIMPKVPVQQLSMDKFFCQKRALVLAEDIKLFFFKVKYIILTRSHCHGAGKIKIINRIVLPCVSLSDQVAFKVLKLSRIVEM